MDFYKQEKKIPYHTNKIDFRDIEIIHLLNPKLKNTYIQVKKEGVILKTPKVSMNYINNLLLQKEDWIRKKLSELEKKTYITKEIVDENKAKEYLRIKTEYFSNKMGLEFNKLKFKKMKRRWGSCDSNKNITLNTYLYNAPKQQIEYVIIHELAHLVHMNHSKEFHALVGIYMPQARDFKTIEKDFHLL